MKNLAISDLKKVKACQEAINKFLNTKELHNIDIDNINLITTHDESLFNDIIWGIDHKLFKIKQLTYVNPNGNVYSYNYNVKKNMLIKTISDGKVWTSTYDERGNKLTETDPDGKVWTYTYDEKEYRLTQKNPNGEIMNYNTYDKTYDLTGFTIS